MLLLEERLVKRVAENLLQKGTSMPFQTRKNQETMNAR
jgi:hypothetical protein